MSAQQTGNPAATSSHSPAHSSVTQIVVRELGNGLRSLTDQHGTHIFTSPPPPPPPPAAAPDSPPAPAEYPSGETITIVVGGFMDPESGFAICDSGCIRLRYSAQLSGASVREGVTELDRVIREQRALHPGAHIKVVGYSEGAAVVHTWTSENSGTIDNVNAVLISDPKREGAPGGDGAAAYVPLGEPLQGADQNFGDIPTVSVCTNDIICDSQAPSGVIGYATGAHGNYSFNVDDYSNDGNGEWFNGQFTPR